MTAVPAGQDVTGTRQLEAWRQRVLPPVEQLAADLWSIPVPIPNNPLRYVSSYAFASGGGLVVLDTGWDVESAWVALVAGLQSIGASPADVRGILVSHMHLDHFGLAGQLQEASGAWIAMHPADIEIIARGLRNRTAAAPFEWELAFLRSLGAEPSEAKEAVGAPGDYARFSRRVVPDRPLNDGDIADVPGWRLRAVHTPGHTPGHLCFVDELAQRFFAGDHILPRITPNISLMMQTSNESPLHDYLLSLAKVRDLEVDEVFPAHEWRFRGLTERADDIAAHHEKRLAELLAAIAANPDTTPWFLAGQLTWSRPWDQYNGRMRISAVNEAAAHVVELLDRGLIVSSGGDVPRYRVAEPAIG
jgi:glyoxylase-like metal-dependent hydrolase (beta-lactamase superfamily II)